MYFVCKYAPFKRVLHPQPTPSSTPSQHQQQQHQQQQPKDARKHDPAAVRELQHLNHKIVSRISIFHLSEKISASLLRRRVRERWRSIVISASVCVSLCVCLSVREHISRITRAIITNFFAYRRGSVLLRRSNAIPRGKGQFCVFSSQLTVHSIWDPYENG